MSTIPSLYAGRDALVALTNALHSQHERIQSLEKENADLKRMLASAADRIGQQSELLSRRAERDAPDTDIWREEAIQRMEWEGGVASRG